MINEFHRLDKILFNPQTGEKTILHKHKTKKTKRLCILSSLK